MESRPDSMTTRDKLDPSLTGRIRISTVICYASVPARCHASGAAVDVCSDAPAGAQRAERAADGGVVDVARALFVSPRTP